MATAHGRSKKSGTTDRQQISQDETNEPDFKCLKAVDEFMIFDAINCTESCGRQSGHDQAGEGDCAENDVDATTFFIGAGASQAHAVRNKIAEEHEKRAGQRSEQSKPPRAFRHCATFGRGRAQGCGLGGIRKRRERGEDADGEGLCRDWCVPTRLRQTREPVRAGVCGHARGVA